MQPLAQQNLHTTVPLTDEEMGQFGPLPWDGVNGPRIINFDGIEHAEFANFYHVDYVQNALNGKFTMRLTGAVDSKEYENRVLAMAAVHGAITGIAKKWNDWIVLSFRIVRPIQGCTSQPNILLAMCRS